MSFARVFEIFAGVLLRGGLDDLRRGLKDLRGSLESLRTGFENMRKLGINICRLIVAQGIVTRI